MIAIGFFLLALGYGAGRVWVTFDPAGYHFDTGWFGGVLGATLFCGWVLSILGIVRWLWENT